MTSPPRWDSNEGQSIGGLHVRLFITGASGWIGSAVVAQLIENGHEVLGLARSDASATKLLAMDAQVHRGSLDDLESLASAARSTDGVVHLAFMHDIAFSGDFLGAAIADRRAIETFAEALEDSDKPLVIASGTTGYALGRPVTEHDGHGASETPDVAMSGPELRGATAEFTLSLASRGVRSVVVRLPPTNHGQGDNGFIAALVAIARAKGVAGYIGDGTNRWPAVHRLDSARLFRLAVESAPPASTLHAVAEEGVQLRDVAEVMGRHLNVPVASIDPVDAEAHFTWLGRFVGLDTPASSALTRELMHWEPTQHGLIADLDQGHYFAL